MEETKINTELQERITVHLISGIANVILAAFGVVALGTVAIPAILAHLFGWKWLTIYPGVFAICALCASRKKR